MSNSEGSILKTITDLFVWLFFVGTILLTLILLGYGTYYTTQDPTLSNLIPYGAAAVTLAMHYAVRQMPAE